MRYLTTGYDSMRVTTEMSPNDSLWHRARVSSEHGATMIAATRFSVLHSGLSRSDMQISAVLYFSLWLVVIFTHSKFGSNFVPGRVAVIEQSRLIRFLLVSRCLRR